MWTAGAPAGAFAVVACPQQLQAAAHAGEGAGGPYWPRLIDESSTHHV
jgi:hypothetical protein